MPSITVYLKYYFSRTLVKKKRSNEKFFREFPTTHLKRYRLIHKTDSRLDTDGKKSQFPSPLSDWRFTFIHKQRIQGIA